jgi:hypothetical protein
MTEVDVQVMRLSQKANDLHAENDGLKAQLKHRCEYEFNPHWNFYRQIIGSEKVGAFCPRCMDKDGVPVRMLENERLKNFKCPECETENTPSTPSPISRTLTRG